MPNKSGYWTLFLLICVLPQVSIGFEFEAPCVKNTKALLEGKTAKNGEAWHKMLDEKDELSVYSAQPRRKRSIPSDETPFVTGDFPGSRPESRTAGLEKLYSMAVTFIDEWVVPYTLGELMEEYNITVWTDFAEEEFYLQWKEWGKNYIGLGVTFVVGVLFFVFLPLIGLLFCCCRTCCGCCCSCSCCRTPKKGKTSSCAKVSCGLIVVSLTALMVASGICVFLTQDELVKELSDEGFFKDVICSLDTLGTYVNDTLDEIEEIVIVGITDTADDVLRDLEGIPDKALEALNNATHAEDLLDTLESFTRNLDPLSKNLSLMVSTTKDLTVLQGALETNLKNASESLLIALEDCINGGIQPAKNECQAIKDVKLPLLVTDADFRSINTSMAEGAVIAIQFAFDNGLVGNVTEAIDAFRGISDTVTNETGAIIGEIENSLDGVLKVINDAWVDLQKEIRDIDVDGIKQNVTDWAEVVHCYMDEYYRWFYFGISGIITAVAVFNILGLAFGSLCKAPTEKTGACSITRAKGGCCLMVSVALIFILGSLLMLITIVFYAVGGGTEFLLCRHLVVYDETMQKIEQVAFKSSDINYNISIREVIDSCKNNTALYTALRVDENGFNVSELLDLSESGIYEQADKLKNTTIDIGTVEIVSDGLNATMQMLDKAIKGINFDAYTTETAKDIVKTDVRQLAEELLEIASALTSNPDIARNLTTEATNLMRIVNETIIPMEAQNETLVQALTAAETIAHSVDLAELIKDLGAAEEVINNDASAIISELISDTTDSTLRTIEQYIDKTEYSIINDLAGCKPIYDTLKVISYSTCIYFLYPFNSVWFCIGWFLTCCVFTLIFATKLAGYFRQIPDKEEERVPKPTTTSNQQRNQDLEMQAYNNGAYIAPDYDDDEDRYTGPPVRVLPGPVGNPKPSKKSDIPPPKYDEYMKGHFEEVKQKDKEAKELLKKKNKEEKELAKKKEAEKKEAKKKEERENAENEAKL